MVIKEEPLVIGVVHFHTLENAKDHNTINYQVVHAQPPTPVLRRGQEFKLSVDFDGRMYDPQKDIIRFMFSFGTDPSTIKGTRGVASVTQTLKPEDLQQWTVKLTSSDEGSMEVLVSSPADSPVGVWNLEVRTLLKVDPKGPENVYKHEDDIYLLFNPWVKEDQVYMEEKQFLNEYVLNDVGKIWVGPFGGSRGREWVFGQFDEVILPSIMLMLDKSKMKPNLRGNPVLLSRKISQMVNSNDDDGILEGRWDGKYEDGTSPSAWTGSVAIMEQYLNSQKVVKYGQCWVFAGVVTTVCRALGIPCRPVSNLVSAHDANASLTIDRYYDEKNELLDFDPNNWESSMDSIWNYHVWNEAWMSRPDLPKGYGGWQAIDATPQEASENLYQCGPAPVEAVKNGAVGFKYDVPFLLASVNADLIRWKEDRECEYGYSKIDCNKYHIGRLILTKRPFIFDPNGDRDRQDITLSYKAPEGSYAERLALMNGVSSLEQAKRFYLMPSKSTVDIDFDLVELETVNIGEDFLVTVNINNKSSELRVVEAVLSAESVYYTGIKAYVIKKATGSFKVKPNSQESLRLRVSVDEYLEKLVEYCNMKICAIATVTDTGYTWAEEDDFQVIKPPINIQVDKELPLDKTAVVALVLKNPLKKKLTDCKFRLEGPGILRLATPEIFYRDVEPLEEIKLEQAVTPSKVGTLTLVASFHSKELIDITGAATVEVYEE